jgi:hypothetical protein
MYLLEAVKGQLGSIIERYGLRLVGKGPWLVYLVVSGSSAISLVSHPSEGAFNCRLHVHKGDSWWNVLLLDFLLARSAKQVPASVLAAVEGRLEREIAGLAWKLEEAGSDILSGRLDWFSAYEQKIGPAECAVGYQAMELSSLVAGPRSE